MVLIQTLEKPIQGFWDNGPKQVFEWSIEKWNSRNGYSRVGSWEANLVFTVRTGKTDRQTLSYALKHLKAVTRINSTFQYKGE